MFRPDFEVKVADSYKEMTKAEWDSLPVA